MSRWVDFRELKQSIDSDTHFVLVPRFEFEQRQRLCAFGTPLPRATEGPKLRKWILSEIMWIGR